MDLAPKKIHWVDKTCLDQSWGILESEQLGVPDDISIDLTGILQFYWFDFIRWRKGLTSWNSACYFYWYSTKRLSHSCVASWWIGGGNQSVNTKADMNTCKALCSRCCSVQLQREIVKGCKERIMRSIHQAGKEDIFAAFWLGMSRAWAFVKAQEKGGTAIKEQDRRLKV